MKRTRYFMVLAAAVFPLALVAFANGCKEKEEELPAPTAAPTPTPTPTPPPVAVVAPEEDAGMPDVADAADEADAKKVTGTGDPSGIRKCCNALAQNMKSAPPDQQLAYGSALAVCNGLVNSPQGVQALGAVRAALRGAGAPAACQ